MEFIISTEELCTRIGPIALSHQVGFTPSYGVVKIGPFTDGKLEITLANEAYILKKLFEVEEIKDLDGEFGMSLVYFNRLVKVAKGRKESVRIKLQGNNIVATVGRGVFRFPSEPLEDVEKIYSIDEAILTTASPYFEIFPEQADHLFKNALFGVSGSQLDPTTDWVNFCKIAGQNTVMTRSTDKTKLAKMVSEVSFLNDAVDLEFSFMIPRETVDLILKEEETLGFTNFSDYKMLLTNTQGTKILSSISSGPIIPYHVITDRVRQYSINIPREELAYAIDSVTLMSVSDDFVGLRLDSDSEELSVYSSSERGISTYKIKVSSVSNLDFNLMFPPKMLGRALLYFKEDVICFSYEDPIEGKWRPFKISAKAYDEYKSLFVQPFMEA